MAQYIINKKMSEIEIYDKSRDAFDFFIISLGLIFDLKKLKDTILKQWLKEYYLKMQNQIRLLANHQLIIDEDEYRTDMRNFLDKIHENRMQIYTQYTNAGKTINTKNETT